MDYVALGMRIRQLRYQRRLTQEQLAELSHLSASFLGHIERGSRKASLETIVCIANSLDAGIDELLIDSLKHRIGTSHPYSGFIKQAILLLSQVVTEDVKAPPLG